MPILIAPARERSWCCVTTATWIRSLRARSKYRMAGGRMLRHRLLPILLAALTAGCGPRAPERFGRSTPHARRLSIQEIESHAAAAEGTVITTSGRVTRVCQHVGCWFYLTD